MSTIQRKRTIKVFVLAMLNLSVLIGLRGLPFSAQYGFGAAFFYLLAAVIFMIPYGLISAELASGWPKGGGVYIWVREALGETWGFVAVWMQWFHNMALFPAMLAFTAGALGSLIYPELFHNRFILTLFILVVFWAVTFYNFFGIESSSKLSTFCVIIGAIFPGALLSILGIIWLLQGKHVNIKTDFSAFFPSVMNKQNLAFLANIFLTLTGLEANANLAREVQNPRKNFPKAIFLATVVSLAIYIFGSIALSLVLNMREMNYVTGILDASLPLLKGEQVGFLFPFLAFCLVLGSLGQINAWTITGIKGLFFTTEHGALPPFLHKTNRKYVPTTLLLFQGLLVSLFALLFASIPSINISFWILTLLGAQTYLVVYVLLFLTGIILKHTKPTVPRAYEVPGGKIGMWLIGGVGFIASLFAFALGFFPPKDLGSVSDMTYILAVIGVFIFLLLIPIVISLFRKPSWKKEVLEEIREEIHLATHPME